MPLHRYIAFLFHGEPEDKSLVVMHSCNNPQCINPVHLSYGTTAQNTKDAVRDGLILRGSNAVAAKLTEEQVLKIKRLLQYTPNTMKVIADLFGVSIASIKDINRGRSWTHVTNCEYPIREDWREIQRQINQQ
jgi:hypothetical protein